MWFSKAKAKRGGDTPSSSVMFSIWSCFETLNRFVCLTEGTDMHAGHGTTSLHWLGRYRGQCLRLVADQTYIFDIEEAVMEKRFEHLNQVVELSTLQM